MVLFRGWGIVAASAVSFSTNPGQFAYGALGVFMLPLIAEFQWSRTDISLALTVFTGTVALSLPVVGRLVDRYGVRKVLFPSVLIFGLLLMAIPVLVSELWHLWLMFLLIGSLAAGANSLPYLRLLSAWFDRRRGLAFGLAMAGGGLGYTYVPPLLQWLIGQWGWRSGYLALGAIVLLVSAPLVWFLLRDTPKECGLHKDGDAHETTPVADDKLAPDAPGQGVFLTLLAVFAVVTLCLYGLLAHFVPLLVDRGIAPADAAWTAAILGSAILVARGVVGYVIDRWFAPWVAAGCFVLTALGMVALAAGAAEGVGVVVATCFVGLSLGAEIDLLAYLTSRYFGVQRFGTVYGMLFSGFMVGTAVGPVVYGTVFDHFGNYLPALLGAAAIMVGCALATLTLPHYQGYSRV